MIARNIDEEESGRYTANLADILGVVPVLTAATLTLYDEATGAIINGRNAQAVLNANNCTYDNVTGIFVWEILPADNPILDATRTTETHVAQFIATYNVAPVRIKPWSLVLWVKNLAKVT